LGLIAKNVRNVPVLQAEHRPTQNERRIAIDLSDEASRIARRASILVRREFGNADSSCRVGRRSLCSVRIITHSEPDGDAIVSAWLAERFLLVDEVAEVIFVPRPRVIGAHRPGDCLVDVGNTHDPGNLFFDHKRPAFRSRHASCAAKLVWDHVRGLGIDAQDLEPLIRAVFAGDSPKMRPVYEREYRESGTNGFHAELPRIRGAGASDAETYRGQEVARSKLSVAMNARWDQPFIRQRHAEDRSMIWDCLPDSFSERLR
jgi:hypothetical protein